MRKTGNLLAMTLCLSMMVVILPAAAQSAPKLEIQPPSATVTEPGTTVQTTTVTSTPMSKPSSTTVQTTVVSPAQSTTTIITTDHAPALKPPVTDQAINAKVVQFKAKRHRSDWHMAVRSAKYHWLDKACESDPSLVEAICTHYTGAMALARHPRLGAIAETDHYTCRRLTKWKTVARVLARNGECYKVVNLDPEGIYRAIKRDRLLAKLLATNPMFDQMIDDNPDLGRLMSLYM